MEKVFGALWSFLKFLFASQKILCKHYVLADRAKRVRDCSFGIPVRFLVSESRTVLPNKNILDNGPRFPYEWKTKVIKVC